jgi:hypothetical protein
MDDEVERLSYTESPIVSTPEVIPINQEIQEEQHIDPKVIITHTNGLVDGIIGASGGSDEGYIGVQTEIPIVSTPDDQTYGDPVGETGEPGWTGSDDPNDIPEHIKEKRRIEEERLERLRAIARENLKKK